MPRYALLVLAVVTVACNEEAEPVAETTEPTWPEIDPEAMGFDLEPPPAGVWRERDGHRICDGYLTRIENEDYCAAEIPADWEPFEFDGQVYYIQPLGGSEARSDNRSE